MPESDSRYSTGRAFVSVLTVVSALVTLLLFVLRLFGEEVTAILGITLAAVVPKLAEIVERLLLDTRGSFTKALAGVRASPPQATWRIRRYFPRLPPQDSRSPLWLLLAATLLLESAGLPVDVVASGLDWISFEPEVPIRMWWLLPGIVLNGLGFVLAGYVIGRMAPGSVVQNLTFALYLHAMIYMVTSDPTLDFQTLMALGLSSDQIVAAAPYMAVGGLVVDIVMAGTLAFYSAQWGVRHSIVTQHDPHDENRTDADSPMSGMAT